MTTFDLVCLLFFLSLFCHGLFVLFSPGFIFGGAGDLLEEKLPKWLFKPLIGCVTCMASVWGTLGYLLVEKEVTLLIPFIVALAGLNYLLNQFTLGDIGV